MSAETGGVAAIHAAEEIMTKVPEDGEFLLTIAASCSDCAGSLAGAGRKWRSVLL